MLSRAQSFDTKDHVSAQWHERAFSLGKICKCTRKFQSLALKDRVPNEALSCNLFLRHVSATVYDIAKCKTSAKVPCQIESPNSIIFLISCFIALKRDATLSIRFCDSALFSYMGSNHPAHVHIVRVSWAFSQSPPKTHWAFGLRRRHSFHILKRLGLKSHSHIGCKQWERKLGPVAFTFDLLNRSHCFHTHN